MIHSQALIDRLRYAARALCRAAVPSAQAVWSPSTYPHGTDVGAVVLQCRAARGPTLARTQRIAQDTPTSVLLTVGSPGASDRFGVRVSDVLRFVDGGGRDALLAELQDPVRGPALLPGVTAVGVGSDAIRLNGAAGTLYEPEALGAVTLTIESTAHAELVTGPAAVVLEIEAWAGARAPIAQSVLLDVSSALRGQDVTEIEEISGCTFGRHPVGDVVDLTALSGPTWESRAVVRVAVSLRSTRATVIEEITTVGVTLAEPAITTEVSAP